MHRRHLAERHALLAVLLLVTASASPSLAIMPLRPDLREAAAKAGSASGPHFPTLLAPAAPGEVRTTGEIRALVLMIDFADSPAGAGHPASFFQNLLFAEQGKSLTTYYRENSYGQLHVTGEVTGWLRSNRSYRNDYVNRDGIPGTADDYGFDTSPRAFDPRVDPYPKNVWGLVMEAASLADPAVDFCPYD